MATNPSDPFGGLTGADRDIAVAITNLFKSYGLASLAPKILDFVKQGYSADTVSILLQDTAEYKQRFAANEVRLKNHLPVLSPAEYLATENAYRDIMRTAGLPAGFYDQPSDFEKFLATDVSPTELKSRVDTAADVINKADPNTLSYISQWYTKGDLVAYALDPKRAAPIIERQYHAAELAAAAKGQSVTVDQATAERLANLGVSQDAARQGFGAIAAQQPTLDKLGALYGDQVSQQDLVGAVFEDNATATEKVKRLASKERAAFTGSSGLSKGSLSQSDSGAF